MTHFPAAASSILKCLFSSNYRLFFTMGFPGGSEVKASACNAGYLGLIPGLGKSPGEGNGNPLQYYCLENPMDRGAWRGTDHRVAKNQTQRLHFHFHQCRRHGFDPWVGKIPWRRKWQPTPIFLPGKSHGQRSLVGYTLQGSKESDTTERLHFLIQC